MENITVDEKGIYLQAENLFDAGNEYELDISVNSGGNIYAQNVNVKVVPEEVFWQPEEGLEELSWNYDINWKDKKGKQAFIPLKSTNVVLKSDQNTYPLLSSPESEAGKTPFIEYDYNFQPNACSEILFEKGSELGNPYFLDYNTAQIEWEINTLQWYNMSPPLKNMYSGDFMFDRLNPLSELQMHNVKNPQTGFYSTDWTHSFNNTNVLLNAGQGYNLRVGNLYYTQITENGADFSSETTLDKVVYKFPDSRYSFQFYDEIIKETSDRIEYIPEDGRDFSNRFIYESIRNEECVVPEGDILFKRDLPVSDGEAPVVIGNPFMSHFDFEMFYLYNYQSILPEFKLLNSDGDYETVLGIDEDHNGMINKYVSTNESIGLYSIQPMQSFIVTTRENYAGQPLIFNKFMSRLKTKNSGERDNSEDILFIRLEENAKTLSKAVVYFPEKEESSAAARRSSRKMINEQTKEPAHIFTVSDDKFLDVNSLNNENEIEIGIIASENNDIHLIIDNLSSFRLKDEWYLYDRETNTHISFVNKEKVVYPFKRTNQEVNNRFCIKRNFNSLSDLENRNKIEVSVNDEFIYITSDKNDPIQSVVISGIDGRKIGKHTYRNISQVDIK
ncbi:MAG: hypothetical protein LIO93_01165, partial [Bacteroidales bacterium]|nr:hypothetical protein [Bacteroidales bacterium]